MNHAYQKYYESWHNAVTASENKLGGCWAPAVMSSYTPNLIRWLCTWFPIKNVADIGCGAGESLRAFRMCGCQVVGVEGLAPAATLTDVPTVQHNMEKGPIILHNIDLAFSIEFVEHVGNSKAVVDTLAYAKMICMSHALPGQGGHHHVNCQPPQYWIDAFKERGFRYLAEFSEMARTLDCSYFSASGMIFLKREVDWGTHIGSYREE